MKTAHDEVSLRAGWLDCQGCRQAHWQASSLFTMILFILNVRCFELKGGMDALTFYPQFSFSGLVVLQWALMWFRRQLWIWDFYHGWLLSKCSLVLLDSSAFCQHHPGLKACWSPRSLTWERCQCIRSYRACVFWHILYVRWSEQKKWKDGLFSSLADRTETLIVIRKHW